MAGTEGLSPTRSESYDTLDLMSSENWETIEERIPVKSEIMDLIETAEASRYEPPFSRTELIVTAILCSNDKTDVLEWILQTFTYYNKRQIKTYLQYGLDYEGTSDTTLSPIIPGLFGAFDTCEVPLRNVYNDDSDGEDFFDEEDMSFTVSARAGRVFLKRWLEPPRDGVFPFLKLPPELRNSVYDLVCALPETRLRLLYHALEPTKRPVGSKAAHVTARLVERTDGSAPQSVTWHSDRAGQLSFAFESKASVLALLLTCKQVYQEAMPSFYCKNMFHFLSIGTLHHILTKMPAKRT
ncbi:hypothetical protein LTR85_009517 [Meristemomyces frigidus]|nr:hypothetical protein LTR85_009517 [Meristemomyces frigidus]